MSVPPQFPEEDFEVPGCWQPGGLPACLTPNRCKKLSFSTKVECFAEVLPGICDGNNRHSLTMEYFIHKESKRSEMGGAGAVRVTALRPCLMLLSNHSGREAVT